MIRPILAEGGQEMYVVYVHHYQYDVLRVMQENTGRNWRRVKRELRKLDVRYRHKR